MTPVPGPLNFYALRFPNYAESVSEDLARLDLNRKRGAGRLRILNRTRTESRAEYGPSPSILSLSGRGEDNRNRLRMRLAGRIHRPGKVDTG